MSVRKPGKSVVTSAIASLGVLGATVSLPLGTAGLASAHDDSGHQDGNAWHQQWQGNNSSGPSDPNSQSQKPWTQPSIPQPAQHAGDAPSYYTVVRGDSLSSIAYEHHVSGGWSALWEANKDKISDPNLIHPGQHLRLSSSSHTPITPAPAPKPTPAPAPSGGGSSSNIPTSAGCSNMAAWTAAAHQIIDFPASWDSGLKKLASDESSCNPKAINNWDSNAAAGTPSKGLMQVIDPTFATYHVAGHNDIWNPVDNLAAAVNYIKHVYGYVPSSPY